MSEPSPPTPVLSIVVAVRDGWEETFRLLMGLVQGPPPVPHELVVVDDGSTDETPLGLPLLAGLVVHRNDEPLGLVRAANQGAAMARGTYTWFLAPGAAPSARALLPLLAALEADAGLAAAGPRLDDARGTELAPDAAAAWADGAGASLPADAARPSALPLQGLVVRTAALRAAGGLDAAFRDRLAEIDLCWRLQDRGGRIARVPGAVLELPAPTAGPATEDDTLLAERWTCRFGPPPRPAAPEAAEPVEGTPAPAPSPVSPLGAVARLHLPPSSAPQRGARPLAVCALHPDIDGTYELELRLEDGKRRRGGKVRRQYAEPASEVAVPFLPSGWSRTVTPREVVDWFAAGYDLEAESERYARSMRPGEPARIAFTAVRADLMSGGSINLLRLANWLVDMGAEVTIYADCALPAWGRVNARFRTIGDPAERYAAIEEPVVVVFSVLELQRLLRSCDHRGKRIYHLCQGAEEFHYATEPPPPLLTPNGLFDLLNAVPVGRIVVSPHLERYFGEKYGQRTTTIVNGVDGELFRPPAKPRRPTRDQLAVLVSGNPLHPLKGISAVKEALALLARRHPRWNLRLINLCGMKLASPNLAQERGFVSELRTGLTPPEVRDQLHQADAYVNASWYEGFGLPSLEAMACGVPVVQADNHGLDGIAQDGRDCLVVPPQEPEAIAAALERLVQEPALRARLVAGGRETAARHTLERQQEEAAAAFSELTGVPLRAPARASGLEAGGERPRFSVLLPTFNQAHFLPAALDSLMAQTDPDWEALVVDDGSTDATAEVMVRYADRDRRIRRFHKENGGVASALNRGLAEARGDWVCWLSSDDLFLPEKLSVHREAARADPGLRLMHTNFLLLHQQTGQLTRSGISAEGVPSLAQQVIRFLRFNYFNGISVALHRSIFERVGGFDEEFRYGQDYDLWLRASARYRSLFVDKATCVTRLHPTQGTALFTEAGIYDSARAAAAFLLAHPLADLFPALDLSQPQQALQALSAVLAVAFSPDSYLVRCGFSTLLLERLKEWIGQLPDRLRLVVRGELEAAMGNQTRPDVRSGLRELASASPGHRFRPADPFALLAQHLARLERGGETGELAAVRRYLAMITDTATRGKLARAG